MLAIELTFTAIMCLVVLARICARHHVSKYEIFRHLSFSISRSLTFAEADAGAWTTGSSYSQLYVIAQKNSFSVIFC